MFNNKKMFYLLFSFSNTSTVYTLKVPQNVHCDDIWYQIESLTCEVDESISRVLMGWKLAGLQEEETKRENL
jgi:hypothetical protein